MRWHHTHSFKDLGDGRTEMLDRVEFLSPGWILEPLINALFIEKRVAQIFKYREQKLTEIFG